MAKSPGNTKRSKGTPRSELAALPFPGLARQVLTDLAAGRCASVFGLSNTGKSTFLRGLATDPAETAYEAIRGRPGALIYVDCNRAVAISVQAFYEVLLRSILEGLKGWASSELLEILTAYHATVTEADNEFAASLAFNRALTDLCESLGRDLCLLIDEFDEIYISLEDRALLNMRALRDRFPDRLLYVTATVRRLPNLRGRVVEDEFAEMFSRSTYCMPALREDVVARILGELEAPGVDESVESQVRLLAGGHPGLLLAIGQVLANPGSATAAEILARVAKEPQAKAECLKIWNQLSEDERGWLTNLVLDKEAGLPAPQTSHLESLGVLSRGEPFSPLFAQFVARRTRTPEVGDQGIYVDHDSGDVWVEGTRIPMLTDLEFRLMALLDDRRDKLTDKYMIVTQVWGEDYLGDVDDARVEKLVSRLRGKIEQDPANPRFLVTQRGRGYKLLSNPLKSTA